MGKVFVLKSVQRVPADMEKVWQFFSDPANLFVMTPPSLNLKNTNQQVFDAMYPGQVITYWVRPILGIPLFWLTEITHVAHHRFFVDEQRKGPYSMWHHQHHFKPVEGGVEMIDLVHYSLPLGPLGTLAHSLLVKSELRKIFTYRYHKINELFGAWPDQNLQLQMS